jgi:hypothetical protein
LIDDLPESIFKTCKNEGVGAHLYLRGFEALRLCRAKRTDMHESIGFMRGLDQGAGLAFGSLPPEQAV